MRKVTGQQKEDRSVGTWEEGGNGADGGGFFGGGNSKIVVASANSELGKFALIFRFGSKLYKLPDTASRSCYAYQDCASRSISARGSHRR